MSESVPSPTGSDRAGEPHWRLEGWRAFSSEHDDVMVHLDRPEEGIRLCPAAVGEQAPNLLGLSLLVPSLPGPSPVDAVARAASVGLPETIVPSDSWVRGRDLVAVYEPHDPRFLRATAMWRQTRGGSDAIRSWELVASAQTSLLESDAAIAAVSTLPAREAVALDDAGAWRRLDLSTRVAVPATAFLFRCSGSSVLVAVHPTDARGVTVGPSRSAAEATAGVRIECRLFPNAVEKGVLLRGRSLAAIGPSDGDTAWAGSLLERFRLSPPVLTT